MARTKGSLNKKTIERLSLMKGELSATIPLGSNDEPAEVVASRISKTFRVLDRVVVGIIAGRIRSAVIAGAPGCGKTYSVESALTEAADAEIIKFTELKGTTSAIGLYQTLFHCQDKGHVLLLDDCDSIFTDLESLNLLKTALDSSKRRLIHWNKESRVLDREGLPNSFQFDGSCVFVTNKNIAAEVMAATKMSPHYSALISRSTFVDLGIHTKREIFIRLQQVVEDTDFLEEKGIDTECADKILDWISRHIKQILALSVRTFERIHEAMILDPENWSEMAEVTLCRRS